MTGLSTSAAETGLRRDAVGLREVLFQSITDMAPGAAIAAYALDAGLTATRQGDSLVIRGEVRAVPAAARRTRPDAAH